MNKKTLKAMAEYKQALVDFKKYPRYNSFSEALKSMGLRGAFSRISLRGTSKKDFK